MRMMGMRTFALAETWGNPNCWAQTKLRSSKITLEVQREGIFRASHTQPDPTVLDRLALIPDLCLCTRHTFLHWYGPRVLFYLFYFTLFYFILFYFIYFCIICRKISVVLRGHWGRINLSLGVFFSCYLEA